MKAILCFLGLCLFVLSSVVTPLAAQEPSFYSITMPRTVQSLGLGEQGVASASSIDAMAYNPANLVYTSPLSVSFYRNPDYSFNPNGIPLVTEALTFNVPNIGSFGIEYTNWSTPQVYYTTAAYPDGTGKSFQYAEHSFAMAGARSFSNDIDAGVEIRYGDEGYSGQYVIRDGIASSIYKWYFGAGLGYHPTIAGRTLQAGFSLTNMGTTGDEGLSSDPPPSQVNIGAQYPVLQNAFSSLSLQLEATKQLVKLDDNNKGVSAFSSLFNDWDHFPNDMVLHTGVAYRWRTFALGYDWTFSEEFYLGNSSAGPGSASPYRDVFTHGAMVQLGYQRYQLGLGFASIWHNGNYDPFLAHFGSNLPDEQFQATLSVVEWHAPGTIMDGPLEIYPGRIFVFAGVGPTLRVGRFHSTAYPDGSSEGYSNSGSYSMEADFYMNETEALISKLSFTSPTFSFVAVTPIFIVGGSFAIETFNFSSLYRIHPLDAARPFFIEGGFGIDRLHPLADASPAYFYQTTLTAGVGANFQLTDRFYVKPSADFTIMLDSIGDTSAPDLGGYNQFNLWISLGYAVK